MVAEDEEGNRRSYKFLDEKLVKRRKLGPNEKVLITQGEHRDMTGTVVRWGNDSDVIAVSLDLNHVV